MDLRTPAMTTGQLFEVAILAGGEGTRLRERTGRLPKPMVPLRGEPLLEHQIKLCRMHGFTRVLLLVHYEHQVIEDYFGDGSRFGVTLGYQLEAALRGTAGALRDALPRLDDTFLVIYGDTYLDVDLRRFWNFHVGSGVDATLFVHPNDHPADSDLVEANDQGVVTRLVPHPRAEGVEYRNLVNAALYVLQREGLKRAIGSEGRIDLARDTFPALLGAGARLCAYRSPEYIKDAGTPERLDRVSADLESGLAERLSGRAPRTAVFLDRDGTINEEVQFLKHPDQVVLLPDVASAVRRLNRSGRLAVVVTNQSVVARGDVTLETLERIHARLEHLLGIEHAYLDRIYACPHHPDRGFHGEVPEFKVACDCRKPATGSIDAACRDLGIGLNGSWFVGDTTSDMETGRRAHLRTVLVRTGHAGQDGRFPFEPDYVVPDLAAAVTWILDGHAALSRRMEPVAAAAAHARLIAIGGLARSGKSSAAQVLKEALWTRGRAAHVISLDSWIKPLDQRSEGSGVATRYDVGEILATITPLVSTSGPATLDLAVYDRASRAMYPLRRQIVVGPEDALIVEGVPALLVEEIVTLADVRVYMEMPETDRLSRLRADYRWRKASDDAVDALIASRAVDEREPVEAARSRADFVVPAWTAA
jgi:histidinol-phosphate phosphatase family protein